MSNKHERATIPAPPMPATSPSGEHPVVQYMRRKLDSIHENEISEFKKLNERLARVTTPAPKDPRREQSDGRREPSEPPIDYVGDVPSDVAIAIEPDPFPSDKPPPHEE